MKTSVGLLMLATIASCGSKDGDTTKAASGGHASIEAALVGFQRALESGDQAQLAAQLAPTSLLDKHFSCGKGLRASGEEIVGVLLKTADGQAVKGTKAAFVKVEEDKVTEIPVGPFEGDCKVLAPAALSKAKGRWKFEGEEHSSALTLLRLDGRWYTLDVPGL
ncbi:MAG: hypothetical protein ACKV2T_37255 [Kofleriaceae bacterium]